MAGPGDEHVKDQAAVELGRRGGKKRAENMTAEERSENARRAIMARWEREDHFSDEKPAAPRAHLTTSAWVLSRVQPAIVPPHQESATVTPPASSRERITEEPIRARTPESGEAPRMTGGSVELETSLHASTVRGLLRRNPGNEQVVDPAMPPASRS